MSDSKDWFSIVLRHDVHRNIELDMSNIIDRFADYKLFKEFFFNTI